MNKITAEDVRKVAKLSRLDLEEDELVQYSNQLQEIIGYIEQLGKVDTKDISPTTRAVEVVNVLREDSVTSTKIRNELLELAPHREGDFFRVPKILSE